MSPVLGPTREDLLARIAQLEVAASEREIELKRLRGNELRYRQLVEQTGMSVVIVDLDGSVRHVSQRAVDTFGYRCEDMRELDEWLTHAFPDALERVQARARWASALRTAVASDCTIRRAEYRVTGRDGTLKTVELFGVIVGHEVVLVLDDIAERRRTENELRATKALLVHAFDSSPLLMAITDVATGTYLDVNDTVCRVTESSREEIVGHKAIDLGWIKEGDRARIVEGAAGRSDRPTIEVKLRSKSGKEVVCNYWGSIIESADGPRLFSVGEDVTERKKSESKLRENNALLSAVVGASPIGIVVSTIEDGKIVDANDAALRMYGFTREETIGRTARNLSAWARPAQRDEMMRRLREHGQLDQFPMDFRRKSGEMGVEEISGRLIEVGGVHCLLSMIVDVTARKESEQAEAKLLAQLQQAQKMESVGRLAGGVAHDFNNMLTVIIGYADIARSVKNTVPALRESLDEIRRAADRAANLTHQLLAFARRQTATPRVIDVNETISGMLGMLARLIRENIELDFQPGRGVWAVNVDPSQVDQILANLCVNARDAIADVGRIIIETANATFDADFCAGHPEFQPGDYVRISVGDNGSGMDDDVRAHLFEPFYTTKEVGKGTGLGLATVHGIVEQNRGFVRVSSERGKGSLFSLYLRRHAGEAAAPLKAGGGETVLRGGGTVLLVEDEHAILRLAQSVLAENGYTVLPASNPRDAERLARDHVGAIDLLITDVVMPELNGRELANRVLGRHPAMKCLFMSGYTADVIADHGVLQEGVHFLEKPFSVVQLTAAVRECLAATPRRTK